MGAGGWSVVIAAARVSGPFVALAIGFHPAAGFTAQETSLQLEILPDRPYIEIGRTGQELNVDLLVENGGPGVLEIDRVELRVLDAEGHLELRRFVDARNGSGLETLPVRTIEPEETVTVYNPFPLFPVDQALHAVEFMVRVRNPDTGKEERLSHTVRPVAYEQRVDLVLPTSGTVIVWDGNDFHSHHRRQDIVAFRARIPDIRDNPVRFAYDFSGMDDEGTLYPGDRDDIRSWYGYGSPVRAPGTGIVVSAANDVPENRVENGRLVYAEDMPDDFASQVYGNHVIIDHGNGEYSLLAHLLTGSVELETGERVEQGQSVGRIGFSGDTGTHVHLHYQLMGDSSWSARALPSRFRDFERRDGGEFVPVELDTVETGEILRTHPTDGR